MLVRSTSVGIRHLLVGIGEPTGAIFCYGRPVVVRFTASVLGDAVTGSLLQSRRIHHKKVKFAARLLEVSSSSARSHPVWSDRTPLRHRVVCIGLCMRMVATGLIQRLIIICHGCCFVLVSL